MEKTCKNCTKFSETEDWITCSYPKSNWTRKKGLTSCNYALQACRNWKEKKDERGETV